MRIYECENKKHSKSVAIECLEYVVLVVVGGSAVVLTMTTRYKPTQIECLEYVVLVVVGGSAVVLTMTTRYKPTCTPLSGAPRVSSEVFSIITLTLTVIMVM